MNDSMAVALFLHFTASFGVAFVLGHSVISLPLRNWLQNRGAVGSFLLALFECPACLGWWLGATSAIFGLMALVVTPTLLGVMSSAFATSAVNLIAARIVGMGETEDD